jgi:hypothetical protein
MRTLCDLLGTGWWDPDFGINPIAAFVQGGILFIVFVLGGILL